MQSRNEGQTIDYITRTFVHEPDYLARIREEGERRRPGMQISSYEGSLLAWIIRISGATRILEIGTFMGYSTLWMASALPRDGHITSLESVADHAAQARLHIQQSPHHSQINIASTDAGAWLEQQPAQPTYDLVFIDADKRSYYRYLQHALPLVHPRGWIVGDNSLLFGALSGEHPDGASEEAKQAMQQFNATLADPNLFEGILLPTAEGLTVARRKI